MYSPPVLVGLVQLFVLLKKKYADLHLHVSFLRFLSVCSRGTVHAMNDISVGLCKVYHYK